MTTFMPVFSVTLHHSIFGLFQFLRLFCEVEQTVHSLFARIPFALLGFFRFSVPRCGICLWFPIICFRFIEISRPSSWFCQWYQFSHFQSYFSFPLDLCPFLLFSDYCPACLMSKFFAVVVWIVCQFFKQIFTISLCGQSSNRHIFKLNGANPDIFGPVEASTKCIIPSLNKIHNT